MSRGERNQNGRGVLRYVQERLQFFAPPPEESWNIEYATADGNVVRVMDSRFRKYAIRFGCAYPTAGGAAVPVSSWQTLQQHQKSQQQEYRFIFFDPVKALYFVENVPVEGELAVDVEVHDSVWPR